MTRLATLLALLLTVCITGSSAFIRHTQSGLGCEGWPACYRQAHTAEPHRHGQPAPAVGGVGVKAEQGAEQKEAAGAAPASMLAARALHRVSAMIVGLLVVGITLMGWSALRGGERVAASFALAVTAGLAWLGRYTPNDLPLVTLGNVLGGFALAGALSWIVARPVDEACPGARPRRGWALAALGVFAVQAWLGVMISVRHAVDACPTLACAPGAGFDWRIFDPWLAQASGSPGAAQGLQFAHRLAAPVLALAAFVTGTRAMRAHAGARRLGAALVGLVVLQAALGWASASGSAPLVAATAHNAGAALLVMTLAALVRHRAG